MAIKSILTLFLLIAFTTLPSAAFAEAGLRKSDPNHNSGNIFGSQLKPRGMLKNGKAYGAEQHRLGNRYFESGRSESNSKNTASPLDSTDNLYQSMPTATPDLDQNKEKDANGFTIMDPGRRNRGITMETKPLD